MTRSRRAARSTIDKAESIERALSLLGITPDGNGRADCPVCGGGSSGRGGSLSIRPEAWHCYRCVYPDGKSAGGSTGIGLVSFVRECSQPQARAALGYPPERQRRTRKAYHRPRPQAPDPALSGIAYEVRSVALELMEPGALWPGIPPDICNRYALRKLPADVRWLYSELRKDYSDAQLIAAGLSRQRSGFVADLLCAYHGRPELAPVVFPYLDAAGQVVHLSARPSVPSRLLGLLLDSGAHKSINCGRVPMPFGLYQTTGRAEVLGRRPIVLICEGEPDALAVAARMEGAVGLAVPGAGSWQDRFIGMLPRGCEVINALDADLGGDRGTLRIEKSFERAGRDAPECLEMPRGADITDELLGSKAPGSFDAALRGLRARGIRYRDPDTGGLTHIDPHWRPSAEGRVQGSVTSWPKRRGAVDGHGNALRSRLDLVPVVDGWVWVKADWRAIEPRIAFEVLRRLSLWRPVLPPGTDPYGWLAGNHGRGVAKVAINAIINGGRVEPDGERLAAFDAAVRKARTQLQTKGRMVRGIRAPDQGEGLLTAYRKPHAVFGAVVKATASDALRWALAQLNKNLDETSAHIGHQIHDEIWLATAPEYRNTAQRMLVETMERAGNFIGTPLPARLESD